jgi:uncharacterized membrane protein
MVCPERRRYSFMVSPGPVAIDYIEMWIIQGAYFVMFGFYLNVLRVHGAARNRSLTVATALLFVFCTTHCALQIATTTLYNQLVSTSLGDSKAVFDRTLKHYSALGIATNAVYVTSKCVIVLELHRDPH